MVYGEVKYFVDPIVQVVVKSAAEYIQEITQLQILLVSQTWLFSYEN